MNKGETLTEEMVKEYTLKYLRKEGMLKDFDKLACDRMDKRLEIYYRQDIEDNELRIAFKEIESDPYFPIIEMYYRDYLSLGTITDIMRVNRSTITRNKRRLLLKLACLCLM